MTKEANMNVSGLNIGLFNFAAETYRRFLDHAAPNVHHDDDKAVNLMMSPTGETLKRELLELLERHANQLFAPEFAKELDSWAAEKQQVMTHLDDSQLSILLLKLLDNIGDDCYDQLWLSRAVPDMSCFISLNSNADETGIWVIPRVKSYIARKESVHFQTPRFEHFSMIEVSQFQTRFLKLKVCNSMDVRTSFGEKKPLRLALCPLTREKMLRSEETVLPDGDRGFIITGLKDEDYLRRLVHQAIVTAAQERADILIFPEMLGDEAFKAVFASLKRFYVPLPGVICLPTVWKDYRNTAELVNDIGDTIFKQDKQFPFKWHDKDSDTGKSLESGKIEDLRDPDRTVYVFHRKNIGRIVVSICRDFLVPEYRSLLVQQLEPNLIIVPSYSGATTPFINDLNASADSGGVTVWVDTCSALDNTKSGTEFGAVYLPPVHGHSAESNKYGFCQCDREACGGCVQFADILLPGTQDGKGKHVLKTGFKPNVKWLDVYREEGADE